MAAQSLHDSKSALGDFYRGMRAKSGAPKGIRAAAQKLARILFRLITTGQEFDDSRFAADRVALSEAPGDQTTRESQSQGFQTGSSRTGRVRSSKARPERP
jgi:hypothetical protein